MRADMDAGAFSLGPERAEGAVVLVHGFTGSPFEMRPLGEHLARLGLLAVGPRLAGHGTTTRDLAGSRWPDWYASVERAFDAARARAPRVAVCGLSLGGLLTLELARRRPKEVAAICVLACALWLPPAALRFDRFVQWLPGLRRLALPKLAGSDIRDTEMRRKNRIAQGSARMPLPALHSLIELGAHVKPRLGEVRAPALVAHARLDHTVPFACMDHIVTSLGSESVTSLVLERSFHVVTLDVERERVFRAVADHVTPHLRG